MDPNAACDPSAGIFGLSVAPDQADLVLLAVPWDATTSYRAGTHRGPAAILRASHQLDMYDRVLGVSYLDGIALSDELEHLAQLNARVRPAAERVIEHLGVRNEHTAAAMDEVNVASAQVDAAVQRAAQAAIARGQLVAVLGGDHSTPLGLMRALADAHGEFGVLHVDAHADLRVAYEGFEGSHASIMYNAISTIPQITRLVQVGIRDFCEQEVDIVQGSDGRVVTHFDRDLAEAALEGEPWSVTLARVLEPLPQRVYVSFDIDGLAPDLCPNTGTPVPGGLSFAQAVKLITAVVQSGRTLIGFDLCEVAPSRTDPEDEWDANVGARVLYQLCGWTLRSSGRV